MHDVFGRGCAARGLFLLSWVIVCESVPIAKAAPQLAIELFVAPDGNDTQDGSRERPLATLEAARDVARSLQVEPTRRPVTVWIRGGRYKRNATFTLTAADSGTAETPVRYQVCPGETASLVGGVQLQPSWFLAVTDRFVRQRLPPSVRGRVLQVDLFELNELHHLCLEMSDVGAIGCGTDWTYRGNVIRHNFIHDLPKRPYPGTKAVYLDNCASSAAVLGNVFYQVETAVLIGGGRDNEVENNLFIRCDTPVSLDNRGLRWRTRWGHFRPDGPMYDPLRKFRHDQPPWSTRYPRLAGILDEVPQAPLGNTLKKNVSVWSGWRDPEQECRRLFDTHIDRPYMEIEKNYVTDEDPGFVAAQQLNFQLQGDSIVYQQIPGFQPIPFGQIGPRPRPAERP